MRLPLSFLISALSVLLCAPPLSAGCPAAPPNSRLPLRLGPLSLASTPNAVLTDANGVIPFERNTIVVKQPQKVVGLELELQAGSVGPLLVTVLDTNGNTLWDFRLSTKGSGTVTYPIATVGGEHIHLRSENGEGGIARICELSAPKPS